MSGAEVEIKYETITLRLPKKVLDAIRTFYGDPKEYLEKDVVDELRADIEAMTGKDLADYLDLQPVFKTILGATAE
jgi:hypothetical protein